MRGRRLVVNGLPLGLALHRAARERVRRPEVLLEPAVVGRLGRLEHGRRMPSFESGAEVDDGSAVRCRDAQRR
jgi:hypothetical protein